MAKQKEKGLPPEVPPEQPGSPAGEGKPPKFETPSVADGGQVPRVIKPIERAPDGLTRFKLRCDNYSPQPVRYVLARSEAEARACYLKANGLDQVVEGLEAAGVEKVEPPRLVVKKLPD